jgi:vancomycin permeability regulator SanA
MARMETGMHLPSIRAGAARGIALVLGSFTLLNLAAEQWRAGFDVNVWWIDVRWMPFQTGALFLTLTALALLAWGMRPDCSPRRRWLTTVAAVSLTLVALVNTAVFFWLWSRGMIRPGIPIPASLFVVALVLWLTCEVVRTSAPVATWGGRASLLLGAICGILALPLVQIIWFGNTDYRRPADAIVVFGARAYADGRPSDALADRVRTGCQLYAAGYAPRLILSGGPGDGAVHEVEAMRRMALGLGVPEEAIVLDRDGLNTRRTVDGLERLSHSGPRRFLAVSHFYHLARIRLACQRAGVEVRTVPARQSYLLRQIPYSMVREVAALWACFVVR